MKAFAVFAVISLNILNASAGSVFDEKSEAIKEIDSKLKEIKDIHKNINLNIDNELKAINPAGENDLLKHLGCRINETETEIRKDGMAAIRTAIVLAKPVTVIDCIRNVSEAAEIDLKNYYSDTRISVLNIKEAKIKKIGFDKYANTAILSGITELSDQSKCKINAGQGPIENLKKEAIKRCSTAILLLGEIEIRINEPVLSKEYVRKRQEISRQLTELTVKQNRGFENCLNQGKSFTC